ncbi:hypothetical protein D3C83_297020 [compost metagenome]
MCTRPVDGSSAAEGNMCVAHEASSLTFLVVKLTPPSLDEASITSHLPSGPPCT